MNRAKLERAMSLAASIPEDGINYGARRELIATLAQLWKEIDE